MKCFIGIERKLEDITMLYREPVKIDKDWSNMFRFLARVIRLAAEVCSLLSSVLQNRASSKTNHCNNPV